MAIPAYSADLIQQLDQTYPARPPDPAHSEREIWMRAGERRLVERLVATLNQQKGILPNVLVDARPAEDATASNPTRTA